MSNAWEQQVRRVVPYTPGEQPDFPDMIKLNTNENPYPPAPGVQKAIQEMEAEPLRLYPAPGADALVDALAEYHKVKKEQVFVGVGSDDVLAMAFLTFFNSEKPILFPDITYSFYDVWADLFRIPFQRQPLDQELSLRPEDYFGENGGVVFPNPNAPTGLLLPLTAVEEIVSHNQDVVVIVDEAYIDFGGESALPLVSKYENLLVVRTFSKSRSMAGLRIGYAIGSEKLIKYLNDAKYSFNSYTMNRPSLELGTAALADESYFCEMTEKIIATRERAKKELAELGFCFGDSKANFIFAMHPKVNAEELFLALKEKHIFVRYFKKPRIDQYLRITIGTDEQMDQLFAFLKEYLQKRGVL
ncbi:MAG: histidinol-phosphate transaminase [Eubacteriales bacterium]|nr:histidinol-phosphate transaminase [Eubacteriales bacterium]